MDAEFRPEHSGLFATALRRSSTNTDSGQMEETKLSIGIFFQKRKQKKTNSLFFMIIDEKTGRIVISFLFACRCVNEVYICTV